MPEQSPKPAARSHRSSTTSIGRPSRPTPPRSDRPRSKPAARGRRAQGQGPRLRRLARDHLARRCVVGSGDPRPDPARSRTRTSDVVRGLELAPGRALDHPSASTPTATTCSPGSSRARRTRCHRRRRGRLRASSSAASSGSSPATSRAGSTASLGVRSPTSLLAFPPLVLALALVTFLGRTRLADVTLALGDRVDPGPRPHHARVHALRGPSASSCSPPAPRARKHGRIMIREVLPNVLPAMFSIALLGVAVVIVAEGGLAILGAGVNPDVVTWGNIIAARPQRPRATRRTSCSRRRS